MQKPIAWHHQDIDDVLESLETTREGLSDSQVEDRLEEYGPNALPHKESKSLFEILLAQFANPLMIVLVLAAGASLVLREWLDVFVIWAAILLNVVLGTVEEYKADQSLEKLKSYLPQTTQVRRDGKLQTIKSQDIVPGDVLILASGDKITADARIIRARAFEVNEAALTGESTPVKKSSAPVGVGMDPADQASMVFAGTVAVVGHAEAVVVGTAMDTEIGRISGLVSQVDDDKTPLQHQLDVFAKILGAAVSVLAIFVFIFGITRGVEVTEMFKVSVALAVAAIPEGLVVAMTVILAIGMQRILKREALVRRLVASETLGSVSVICMDKTGTLTTGEMTVTGIETNQEEDLKLGLLLTSSVTRSANGDEHELNGTPTEVAIMRWLQENGIKDGACEEISELPFDSAKKYASALVRCDGRLVLFTVGAPEILLDKCDISDLDRQKELQTLEEMTDRGERVLMIAKKEHPEAAEELTEKQVVDLKPVGYVGLRDPLRKEAPKTIEGARAAGLIPIMITGDHPKTALSIARDAGLIQEGHRMLTGAELNEMSDQELLQDVEKIDLFARVMPHHKLRIIRAWQQRGYSVAMTGDGVNDAPALKAADIGIALGSGTEVAKETSDMVLLNNNFGTIVAAIREGRIIFDNIRKVVVYLLADSFSEIILVTGALLFSLPLPILPAQILWINLITDGFPSIAVTFEPGEKGIMKEPPRKKGEKIVNLEMLVLIFIVGIVTDILLFIVFFYLLSLDLPINEIRTFIFVKLGLDSLIYVFAIRKFRTSAFTSNPFENKWLVLAILGGIVLQLLPLFFVPLRELFDFVPLTGLEWLIVISLSCLNFILIEIVKAIFNLRHRKSA